MLVKGLRALGGPLGVGNSRWTGAGLRLITSIFLNPKQTLEYPVSLTPSDGRAPARPTPEIPLPPVSPWSPLPRLTPSSFGPCTSPPAGTPDRPLRPTARTVGGRGGAWSAAAGGLGGEAPCPAPPLPERQTDPLGPTARTATGEWAEELPLRCLPARLERTVLPAYPEW